MVSGTACSTLHHGSQQLVTAQGTVYKLRSSPVCRQVQYSTVLYTCSTGPVAATSRYTVVPGHVDAPVPSRLGLRDAYYRLYSR